MRKPRSEGFTLIELMIAVVIVAILSAVAVPSYQEHVRRTKRIECQAVMLKAASMLERHYSVNHTYSGLTALPTQCPESGAKTYTLAATYTSDGFKLTATRAGSQTNDQCGNFTLDHTGAKEVVSGTTSLSASECWR